MFSICSNHDTHLSRLIAFAPVSKSVCVRERERVTVCGYGLLFEACCLNSFIVYTQFLLLLFFHFFHFCWSQCLDVLTSSTAESTRERERGKSGHTFTNESNRCSNLFRLKVHLIIYHIDHNYAMNSLWIPFFSI